MSRGLGNIECLMLETLARNGAMRPSQILAALLESKDKPPRAIQSSVHRALNGLVRKGLVVKPPGPQHYPFYQIDRKAVLAYLGDD